MAILVLLVGTIRNIGLRLMDGVEPDLVARAESALLHTPGVTAVGQLQLRWAGHRLLGAATVTVGGHDISSALVGDAERRVRSALPNVGQFTVRALREEPARRG